MTERMDVIRHCIIFLGRVTIFSLPKRKTFFDNNYYQPYKLFCKAGKIFLDICWTLTAFDDYILIISMVQIQQFIFSIYYASEQKNVNWTAFSVFYALNCLHACLG